MIYMYNIFLLGDASQGLAHSRRQFSSDISEVWEAFIIISYLSFRYAVKNFFDSVTYYFLLFIIIIIITIRSGRLCDVVAADMDRCGDR